MLRSILSRIILDDDSEIMPVHFEYFSKRLISLFQFYNKDFGEEGNKYIFVNTNSSTWNSSIE